ncbi:MAG: hypothetical protein ABI091_26990 [Ferruginibacter sp.]
MDYKIEEVEKNLSILSKELVEIKELIGTGFKKVSNNFDSIKKEIDSLHLEVAFISKKIDLLKGETHSGLGDVGIKLENLTEEISKISIVTKYDEEYRNLKDLKN